MPMPPVPLQRPPAPIAATLPPPSLARAPAMQLAASTTHASPVRPDHDAILAGQVVTAPQSITTDLAPGIASARRPGTASRWSASAWIAARPGTGIGAAPGGSQIGGSQAGLRVAYLLAPAARLAAFGRVVTPLRGKGREGAVGLEWQPTHAPVRLVAEQRFGLDGTRGGPGLGVIAGYDGQVAGFHLESYGQAGAIWRARREPYADGAVRATRPAVAIGKARLALGVGAWGAAQRDAQRLDIGPSATLAVPVGQSAVRVALDWRQRVAGGARPGSGPALTIGSDF